MLLGRWVAPEGVAIIAETLEAAVEIVTALRGQDWSTLSAAEKRRAAVESVASLIEEEGVEEWDTQEFITKDRKLRASN